MEGMGKAAQGGNHRRELCALTQIGTGPRKAFRVGGAETGEAGRAWEDDCATDEALMLPYAAIRRRSKTEDASLGKRETSSVSELPGQT